MAETEKYLRKDRSLDKQQAPMRYLPQGAMGIDKVDLLREALAQMVQRKYGSLAEPEARAGQDARAGAVRAGEFDSRVREMDPKTLFGSGRALGGGITPESILDILEKQRGETDVDRWDERKRLMEELGVR